MGEGGAHTPVALPPRNNLSTDWTEGKRWCSWSRHCPSNLKVVGTIPDVSLTRSFRPHYGPGVDSASNRNEYRGYFLGGKGGWCTWLTTLPYSRANCPEIWDSHLPEPSEPVRTCTGIVLPFALRIYLESGGPHILPGRLGKEKNLLFLPGLKSRVILSLASTLHWLSYPGYQIIINNNNNTELWQIDQI